jgi:hypothetical protein
MFPRVGTLQPVYLYRCKGLDLGTASAARPIQRTRMALWEPGPRRFQTIAAYNPHLAPSDLERKPFEKP